MRVKAGVWILVGLAGACAATKPERGVAVVAIGNDPGHFNPAVTTAAHVHAASDSLYNGLVGLDEDLNPAPDLATSWEILDGGRTYVFHLAPGVRWHDGELFNAGDVVFTFEHILLRFHSRTRAGLESALEGIEAPDDATVVFRFRAPYAALLQRLDVTEAPILPAHVYRHGDVERHPANLAPVGTGPFRLATHFPDDRIVLVRNEHYFKPGLPYLDELVFRIIPDANTRLLALERGEVDYVSGVRPKDARRLRASGGDFTLVSTTRGPGGGNCMMTWIFNLERPPLDERRIREGLALAIDREQVVERVLFGEAGVPDAPFSSGIAWAHAKGTLEAYRHDLARARELLQGQVDRPLDIVHFPAFLKYGEILRQQLARAGVELTIRALDRPAAVETIYVRREFDTALISYCHGADPDIGIRRMYDSASIAPVPFSNAAAYRNPEVDGLFEEAARLYERDARRKLYHRIQEIVARDLPYFGLAETRSLTAYRSSFEGFAPWSGQLAERARSLEEE